MRAQRNIYHVEDQTWSDYLPSYLISLSFELALVLLFILIIVLLKPWFPSWVEVQPLSELVLVLVSLICLNPFVHKIVVIFMIFVSYLQIDCDLCESHFGIATPRLLVNPFQFYNYLSAHFRMNLGVQLRIERVSAGSKNI